MKRLKRYSELRNLSKTTRPNDGSRSLYESILYPEVVSALNDWISLGVKDCVLIGGVALSYYVKPRTTEDVDILFLSKDDIPTTLVNFKRTRLGAFQHNKTHVEIEVVTPETINLPIDIAKKIFTTSNESNGIRVASPSGIIACKLGRFNRRDQADIEDLILSQEIDMTPFNLRPEELERYYSIYNDVKK
jgi:hypothetical protein